MRRLTAILAGAVLVVLAAAPVLASDYLVTIGSPTVSRSRVVVTVPIQLSCPTPDPSYDLFVQGATVDVEQASGKLIAHGEGQVYGSPLIACDGAWHPLTVSVSADPSGPPFTRGWMSISARAEFMEGIEASPGCGCGFIYVDEWAYAGPLDVRAG